MAEDKDKKGEEKPKGKGGLMAVVFVAVGAVLGGAGVVLLGPKPEPVEVTEHVPEVAIFQYDQPMRFNFQPLSGNGGRHRSARVIFTFDYRCAKEDQEFAKKHIEVNWRRAMSRVLIILKNQPISRFEGPLVEKELTKILIDELTLELFGGVAEPVATVDDILYSEIYIQ